MKSDLLDHPLIRRGFDSIPLGGIIYLATPYTLLPQHEAVEGAAWWQAHLAKTRRVVTISPVAMCARMEPHVGDWTHDDWMQFCYPLLDACRCVAVPPMAGWNKSVGVNLEIERALARNMPVILG